jgi:hypothetical protein
VGCEHHGRADSAAANGRCKFHGNPDLAQVMPDRAESIDNYIVSIPHGSLDSVGADSYSAACLSYV